MKKFTYILAAVCLFCVWIAFYVVPAVPEILAAGDSYGIGPAAFLGKDKDPSVGFPGMHYSHNSYMKALGLSAEQQKSLDALNRKYTAVFSDKYSDYLKELLQQIENSTETQYYKKGYLEMLEDNKKTGAEYEAEFKKLLGPEQLLRYGASVEGAMLRSYAFGHQEDYSYGLLYEPGFMRHHNQGLRPEQENKLQKLNKRYAKKLLRVKEPGKRALVMMRYKKALNGMLDEGQRYDLLHMFDGSAAFRRIAVPANGAPGGTLKYSGGRGRVNGGYGNVLTGILGKTPFHSSPKIVSSSGIDWSEVEKKRKERGPLFDRRSARKLFDQVAEKTLNTSVLFLNIQILLPAEDRIRHILFCRT